MLAMTLNKKIQLGALALVCALAVGGLSLAGSEPALAQGTEEGIDSTGNPVGGAVPGNSLGTSSDTEFWRAVRGGAQGTVSIPDQQAGVLVQSEGDNWRAFRNGPLMTYGAWIVLGMIGLLAIFFLIRGRVKIEAGPSGTTIERFGFIDRVAHWTTAGSFVLLAITGINLLWGRFVLMPVLGKDAFAAITMAGKYVHNYIAFAFMLGLIMIFVLWVRHNIPNKYDLIWLAKGGGLFSKHSHPPSKKFNAGQKIIFWATILGGASLSLSGIGLLFPYETAMWAKTLPIFGVDMAVTPLMEQQLNTLWHSAVSLVMIAIILAHIYIGSIGMEGAFSAMGSGQVDENWAREHHNLWVEEVKGESSASASTQPAE